MECTRSHHRSHSLILIAISIANQRMTFSWQQTQHTNNQEHELVHFYTLTSRNKNPATINEGAIKRRTVAFIDKACRIELS